MRDCKLYTVNGVKDAKAATPDFGDQFVVITANDGSKTLNTPISTYYSMFALAAVPTFMAMC